MSAVPVMTAAAPTVTAQDLELEHAELLPARETLWVTRLYPRYCCQGAPAYPGHPVYPGGPVHFHPDSPARAPEVM
jgi:hypothetical protein